MSTIQQQIDRTAAKIEKLAIDVEREAAKIDAKALELGEQEQKAAECRVSVAMGDMTEREALQLENAAREAREAHNAFVDSVQTNQKALTGLRKRLTALKAEKRDDEQRKSFDVIERNTNAMLDDLARAHNTLVSIIEAQHFKKLSDQAQAVYLQLVRATTQTLKVMQ